MSANETHITHITPITPMKGEYRYSRVICPLTGKEQYHLSGWYFYPEEGGFYGMDNLLLVHTHEKKGKCVALSLRWCKGYAGFHKLSREPMLFPPLPEGVPLAVVLGL